MNLQEALQHLINSEKFQENVKRPDKSKFRQFLIRMKSGNLGNGAAFNFLIDNGYNIEITEPGLKPVIIKKRYKRDEPIEEKEENKVVIVRPKAVYSNPDYSKKYQE